VRSNSPHKQKDDVFRFGREMRREPLHGLRGRFRLQQRGQCRAAESKPGLLEKMPPREVFEFCEFVG
jgi:hypothetical protein